MGFDSGLYKIKREDFYNYNRNDFWYVEYELQTEEMISWRKEYDIHHWFYANTNIIEDYSDEVTFEKLSELFAYLILKSDRENAEKVNELINGIDFKNYVIYYYGSN